MKLKVIRTSVFLRRLAIIFSVLCGPGVIVLVIVLLLLSGIDPNFFFKYFYFWLLCIAAIYFVLYFKLRLFITHIGELSFQDNQFSFHNSENILLISDEVKVVRFYYGGYYGDYSFLSFLFYNNFVDGTANYIEINKKVYHIRVDDKIEALKLLSWIKQVAESGIETEILKLKKSFCTLYLRFPNNRHKSKVLL